MNKNATIPKTNYKTTREVLTSTQNFALIGVESFRAERTTTTFEVVRKLHSKTKEPLKIVSKEKVNEEVELLNYPLIEVSPKELADYREKEIPSFVLKVDGKLYYTEITRDIKLSASALNCRHRCAVSGHECNRLSAASDEDNGCEKVRNLSTCIENYPWITDGYETFNTDCDAFIVINCLHYEACPPRK